jgi:hypothetical protein
MTDLTLLGINKYIGNSNCLVLEIKENVLDNQMLDTVSMLINNDNENKQIIFINYNEYEENTFNIRIFDENIKKFNACMDNCGDSQIKKRLNSCRNPNW